MKCDAAYELVQEFVDGLLPAEQRARFESHMEGCGRCSAEVHSYGRINVMLTESLAPEPVPAGFSDRIIGSLKVAGRIREVEPASAGILGWLRTPLRAPLAAAMLLLIAVSLFPVTGGLLEGLVGKGTVVVADTVVEFQEKASADVGVFTRFVATLQKTFRTLKTVALAAVSLVIRAGELFMIPATAMLMVLIAGVVFFFRAARRRSTHHVSLSF